MRINGLGSMSVGGSMDQGPERGGKRSLGLGQVRLHAAPPSPLREIYHRVQNLEQREKKKKKTEENKSLLGARKHPKTITHCRKPSSV
jgi:CRISPR/Cas system CSM-associated protein Csm3 (group 7 of RAMP superfamily)